MLTHLKLRRKKRKKGRIAEKYGGFWREETYARNFSVSDPIVETRNESTSSGRDINLLDSFREREKGEYAGAGAEGANGPLR